jgi:polyisoprenoid-binding protein YceI
MIKTIAILASLYGAAAAAADNYTIDPAHTFPRFEINHFGFSNHRGQFNKTAGKLVLDRIAKTGSLDIKVQTASIGTGDPRLEEELRGDKFFNVEKFPTMVFRAKSVKFNGDVPASAEGELTLLGVTRPLTLTISQVKCGSHPYVKKEDCGAEVSGSLKRSDFGMKAFIPMVGDDVSLHIQVEAWKD